ncbi:class I SAM-dependent methyltransferase [Microbulbifer sp. CNSA002]|uniref:class I SAM-dependent methyltransferase n=1 Tax=Microbulbifer sp. CNSA002 TaxID=3373604 RepID=UPI0039B6251F
MSKDPKLIAEQLRKPSGTLASETAQQMNKANEATNLAALTALNVVDGDSVLEIGPGNGKFAVDVIRKGSCVRYTGIDWSSDMVATAKGLNFEYIESGQMDFLVGSSESLPFADKQFDKVLAVHTIYFWDTLKTHLAEISSVLATKGKLCLAFGDKSFMQNLPFTQYGFRLFDEGDICTQLSDAGFKVVSRGKHSEYGESNTGQLVEKKINIIVCELNP